MHQDITPLCAADIQDQLKKRFAYLSGECRPLGSMRAGVCGAGGWPLSVLVLYDPVGPITRGGSWGQAAGYSLLAM